MRTIVLFFVILFACAAFMGCGADVKHLVNEGLLPAGKMSVKNASVKSGAQITVNQNNVADMLGKHRITFSGMGHERKFLFIQFDNTRQERTVEKDGTVSFLVPKNRPVDVTYVYGNYGLSKSFRLDPNKDYTWDASTKTFNPIHP